MTHNYSTHNLIKIIYGEAPFQSYFELDEAMQKDKALANRFRKFYKSFKLLESAPRLKPSEKVTEKILAYSLR